MTALWIAEGLDRLRADIAANNTSGNVDGLLARHVVGSDPRLSIVWGVECGEVWLQRSYDPSQLQCVAALAYTVALQRDTRFVSALDEGMQRATSRDPALAGHGAALHDPAVLIGLALAAREFRGVHDGYVAWIGQVLSAIARARSTRTDPMVAYAAWLCEVSCPSPQFDLDAPLGYCAALAWWLDRCSTPGYVGAEQRLALQSSITERALTEPVVRRPAHQAALLWRALRAAVSDETSLVLRTKSTVSSLLLQFESCLRRWRWDSEDLKTPIRWPIRSEREVQDILWVMLRSIFHDLEDEDTLPKFGHSSYKADLGIPSLGLLIEVKFARSAADFKGIEKQILEDLVPYLRSPERYREVLVFVYDDSSSVQEHETTKRALQSVAGVADVIVVSRPSHLPPHDQQRPPPRPESGNS